MDQGTLAHKVVERCGSLETSVQIRVVQGKEPRGFLRIFGGKCVVHLGGYAEFASRRVGLHEIRGCEDDLVAAVQMPLLCQMQKCRMRRCLCPAARTSSGP